MSASMQTAWTRERAEDLLKKLMDEAIAGVLDDGQWASNRSSVAMRRVIDVVATVRRTLAQAQREDPTGALHDQAAFAYTQYLATAVPRTLQSVLYGEGLLRLLGPIAGWVELETAQTNTEGDAEAAGAQGQMEEGDTQTGSRERGRSNTITQKGAQTGTAVATTMATPQPPAPRARRATAAPAPPDAHFENSGPGYNTRRRTKATQGTTESTSAARAPTPDAGTASQTSAGNKGKSKPKTKAKGKAKGRQRAGGARKGNDKDDFAQEESGDDEEPPKPEPAPPRRRTVIRAVRDEDASGGQAPSEPERAVKETWCATPVTCDECLTVPTISPDSCQWKAAPNDGTKRCNNCARRNRQCRVRGQIPTPLMYVFLLDACAKVATATATGRGRGTLAGRTLDIVLDGKTVASTSRAATDVAAVDELLTTPSAEPPSATPTRASRQGKNKRKVSDGKGEAVKERKKRRQGDESATTSSALPDTSGADDDFAMDDAAEHTSVDVDPAVAPGQGGAQSGAQLQGSAMAGPSAARPVSPERWDALKQAWRAAREEGMPTFASATDITKLRGELSDLKANLAFMSSVIEEADRRQQRTQEQASHAMIVAQEALDRMTETRDTAANMLAEAGQCSTAIAGAIHSLQALCVQYARDRPNDEGAASLTTMGEHLQIVEAQVTRLSHDLARSAGTGAHETAQLQASDGPAHSRPSASWYLGQTVAPPASQSLAPPQGPSARWPPRPNPSAPHAGPSARWAQSGEQDLPPFDQIRPPLDYRAGPSTIRGSRSAPPGIPEDPIGSDVDVWSNATSNAYRSPEDERAEEIEDDLDDGGSEDGNRSEDGEGEGDVEGVGAHFGGTAEDGSQEDGDEWR